MGEDTALVGGAFEKFGYVRIISVRENTSVWAVLAEKFVRPEDRRRAGVAAGLPIDVVFTVLLASKDLG
jgi:hypothetical protein